MSLSLKIQTRRTERALLPVYENLGRYVDSLQALQNLVAEEISAGHGSNPSVPETIQDAIESLPSPKVFLPNSLRVKKISPHPLPARRKALAELAMATAYLHTLHTRVVADDFSRHLAVSDTTALQLHARYVMECAQSMQDAIEPRQLRSYGVTAGNSMLVYARHVACRANAFRVLSAAAVESFDEARYLELNEDVAIAVNKEQLRSGFEHFARSGLRESQAGHRDSGAFDLRSIKFAGNAKFDTDEVKQCRDVIAACGGFDEVWYRLSCPHHLAHEQKALNHYVTVGEGLGCMPNDWFDPSWYRDFYQLPEHVPSAFAHYLAVGRPAQLKPNALFDPVYYEARYGSSLPANTDLVAHYYQHGFLRGWQPCAQFNVEQYAADCMFEHDITNPVTHYRRDAELGDDMSYGDADTNHYDGVPAIAPTLSDAEHLAKQQGDAYANAILENTTNADRASRVLKTLTRKAARNGHSLAKRSASRAQGHTSRALTRMAKKASKISDSGGVDAKANHAHEASDVDLASQIKYFANPGPAFELPSKIETQLLSPKARTVAFFLPQFYAFDKNDEWWGTGFTEWRNVSRGTPRFENHYQPRIPRDLGFYDLTQVETLKAQAQLAMNNGIEAFCFYYYWFNGERLMDKPLDLYLDADIDQEFCIMWANENWTRTWDGFEGQVLIQQDYRDSDEDDFIADTARYFNHHRYMKVADRPLFILYRPGLLPDAAETIARWKNKWQAACGVEPWVLMVQGFGDEDPGVYDLDGAVEFPPHKLCADLPDINDQLNVIDQSYSGHARDYNAVIDASLSENPPSFPLVKTVSPHWDNDARREGRGLTLHGSSPENYERWLSGAVQYANENPFHGESLVFINAWNEWAEGAYLEPDVHYGHAYLNATQRAVHGLISDEKRSTILLVGHDAYRHGAQLLLKSIAKMCTQQFGMSVVIALKSGGPMLVEYQEIGTTVVLDQLGKDGLAEVVRQHKIASAICNTSVTGDLVPTLKREGVAVVSLIHELPNLISEYGLENNLVDISRCADHVVFPADMVEDGFNQFARGGSAQRHIRPQGNYKTVEFDADARARIRSELGIDDHHMLVLNVGYADLRKGFDLFIRAAQQLLTEREDVHFVWLGDRDVDIERWLVSDFDTKLRKRLHLVDFTDDVNAWYSAGDAFYLSSREDPYPTVVLEAMAVGMPVILHEGATGFDELVGEYGYRITKNRPFDTVTSLQNALFEDTAVDRRKRIQYVTEECRFDEYCFNLLQWVQPNLKKVSVVVPNYNYEQYIATRLNSVFEQSYPVFEVIVLDDCSSDDSIARIAEVAENSDRTIQFSPNRSNSGNTFKQWQKGMSMVRGDLIWIAEADDLADPDFLMASVGEHRQNVALSFTDSAQIDSHDKALANSYSYYYNEVDDSLFRTSFTIPGDEFVKRAMAVRNVIMNVSSVVWNRQSLQSALDALGDDLHDYKLVGDWRLYLEVLLRSNKDVTYVNRALNIHRRHPDSVTHALDLKQHLTEIQAMHQVVSESLVTSDASREQLREEMDKYVDELTTQFGLMGGDVQGRVAA